MIQAMIKALDAEFQEFPVLVAGPASEEAILEVEAFAGFPLSSSYRAFLARYGGAIVGPYGVYGVGASQSMGNTEASVIDVTNRFRGQQWPGSDDTLVISMDHAGNAIMMNGSEQISRFDHDFGVTEKVADDFEGFILNFCLKG